VRNGGPGEQGLGGDQRGRECCGGAVAVDHVCLACARATASSGVGLYVISGLGLCEPLAVAGPLGEPVAELPVMLGEGPGTEALRADRPLRVPACGLYGTPSLLAG
jgi:hypothetical protein